VACKFMCRHQFIQFQLNCQGIFILRLLNQKNHQKSNNSRTCVDNQLPVFRIMKNWSGYCPKQNSQKSQNKSRGTSGSFGYSSCKAFGDTECKGRIFSLHTNKV